MDVWVESNRANVFLLIIFCFAALSLSKRVYIRTQIGALSTTAVWYWWIRADAVVLLTFAWPDEQCSLPAKYPSHSRILSYSPISVSTSFAEHFLPSRWVCLYSLIKYIALELDEVVLCSLACPCLRVRITVLRKEYFSAHTFFLHVLMCASSFSVFV